MAILRQRIHTRSDKDQAYLALTELFKRFDEWLKTNNGHFDSFEAAWKAFSGEDWKKQ
jgi:hypothetical protein